MINIRDDATPRANPVPVRKYTAQEIPPLTALAGSPKDAQTSQISGKSVVLVVSIQQSDLVRIPKSMAQFSNSIINHQFEFIPIPSRGRLRYVQLNDLPNCLVPTQSLLFRATCIVGMEPTVGWSVMRPTRPKPFLEMPPGGRSTIGKPHCPYHCQSPANRQTRGPTHIPGT